jgi:DNA-binding NtrC family response regulator
VLIAATSEDLEHAVLAGRFREDLYYRLNVVPIVLPPLRERPGDVAILLDHFLRMYCAANSLPLKRLNADALEILEEYHWPGNVRELENLVQRLVIMGSGSVITAKHLPQQILYSSTAKQEALLIPEEGISFDEEVARIELAYLQAALRRTGGKKVAAAALLQINAQKMKYLCRGCSEGISQGHSARTLPVIRESVSSFLKTERGCRTCSPSSNCLSS